jgi:hypothetical protein
MREIGKGLPRKIQAPNFFIPEKLLARKAVCCIPLVRGFFSESPKESLERKRFSSTKLEYISIMKARKDYFVYDVVRDVLTLAAIVCGIAYDVMAGWIPVGIGMGITVASES